MRRPTKASIFIVAAQHNLKEKDNGPDYPTPTSFFVFKHDAFRPKPVAGIAPEERVQAASKPHDRPGKQQKELQGIIGHPYGRKDKRP